MLEKTKTVNGCWEWQGTIDPNGYGRINFRNRKLQQYSQRLAHRAVMEILHGPTRLNVCHTCDNRRCINPAHLFFGTQKQNVNDMMIKGRHSPQRGSNNGMSKIDEQTVRNIITFKSSGLSCREIGEKFGLKKSSVWCILKGHTWKHVKEC